MRVSIIKMLKNSKTAKLLICLFISLCVISHPIISFAQAPTTSSNNEINKPNDIDFGISNLNYNRDNILAVNGDTIENFVPKKFKIRRKICSS